MSLVGDLRERIAEGRAIVVVGAGVALGASGANPTAGWIGLLESGVTWCEDNVPSIPKGWPALVRA